MSGISSYVNKQRKQNLKRIQQLQASSIDASVKADEHQQAYEVLSNLICEIARMDIFR